MNNEEARFILRAYRPNGGDASDPQFTAALEQARRDPELSRWLAEQTALDAAIGDKLRSVPVPSDLKAAILAGHKIIQPQPWWRRRIHPVAAAAAIFVTLVCIGFLAVREPQESAANFKHFSQDITSYISTSYGLLFRDARNVNTAVGYFGGSSYRMNYRSPSIEDIRKWLVENNGHRGFDIPAGLKNAANLKCAIVNWRGRRVSLICFQVGPHLPKDKVHLVVISSADLPDPPPPGTPRFHENGESSTAEWSDGPFTYVLMAPGNRQMLSKYFDGTARGAAMFKEVPRKVRHEFRADASAGGKQS